MDYALTFLLIILICLKKLNKIVFLNFDLNYKIEKQKAYHSDRADEV